LFLLLFWDYTKTGRKSNPEDMNDELRIKKQKDCPEMREAHFIMIHNSNLLFLIPDS